MQKHQQLVQSLGATVVVSDTEQDFFIAEHDALEEGVAEDRPEPVPASEFKSALKSLLTSTTCHKF